MESLELTAMERPANHENRSANSFEVRNFDNGFSEPSTNDEILNGDSRNDKLNSESKKSDSANNFSGKYSGKSRGFFRNPLRLDSSMSLTDVTLTTANEPNLLSTSGKFLTFENISFDKSEEETTDGSCLNLDNQKVNGECHGTIS